MTTGRKLFLWAAAVCPLFAGCAWRTNHADYAFGPTLYRFGEPSPQKATLVQTLHIPFLLEGGRQWGLSVGGVQRLALVPGRSNAAHSPANVQEQSQGLLTGSKPEHWQLSWIYLRAPLREPPVFIRRSVIGLHGGAGTEERAFSLGYSSMTATTPREDAVYRLEFNSRRPLDATFVVNPVTETKQDPQRNGEQP